MSGGAAPAGGLLRGMHRHWADLRGALPFAQPTYAWNSADDVRFAHQDERFSNVIHVFHSQWLGIRAAAGSLPGGKLAIDAHRTLSTMDIRAIVARLGGAGGASRYVFHGMSDNAAMLIRALSASGLAGQSFIVHHGSVAQWTYGPERKLAFQAIELARAGHVKRLHIMKRGHALLGERSYAPLLLNMSPALTPDSRPSGARRATVFMPGTEGWIKNLHCNALGAAMCTEVEEVLHYASGINLPEPWQARLRQVPFENRDGTFRIMAESLATLNVSLTECHPMVALESEAAGTPCLRRKLFLDALEDHPYVRAVEVEDPTSPFDIRDVLQRLLAMPESERREAMGDYLEAVNRLSIRRYLDFLGL